MKRLIITSLLLLGMVITSNAQSTKKVSSVHATKNTYAKTSGLNYGRSSYANERNSLISSSITSKELDGDARVTFYDAKVVYSIVKNTLSNEQLRKAPSKERINLLLLFNSEGIPIRVSFILPEILNISPEQVEKLEKSIKSQLKVNIKFSEASKKYVSYGLPVPISSILDGTYPY